MEQLVKKQKNMLKRKIFNLAVLFIFSIVIISIYYTANSSRAKEIPEITVNIKNSLQLEEISQCIVNATENSDGDAYYIKLPNYINNNKVIKYSYYIEEITTDENQNDLEETEQSDLEETEQSNSEEIEQIDSNESETIEETVDINEIGPNDVLPESPIYLSATEVENKEITIIAHYDTKQIEEKTYYQKKLTYTKGTALITVTGYMPQDSSLVVTEQEEIKDIQTIIRNNQRKPIAIDSVYDIRIKVGENTYAPKDIDKSIEVSIEKEELANKKTALWPVTNNIKFFLNSGTSSTSIYALENVEETLLAIDNMSEKILTVDDAESDRNYWIGRNYTDNVSGEYTGNYTDSTLANVTINYYSYAENEVEPEMVGFVSLAERYNVITYKKTCPIVNGNVSVELIENPFTDRPTGYGFGGWISADGTITKDSKTNIQTITATASNNMTFNIYVNWENATVVYVNGDTGNDNVYNGLTPDRPFGSWGKAISYLNTNSNDSSDREKNIIVMTGNMNTSINYTTPKTYKNAYTASNTFTPGETYIISNTNVGAGGNAFTAYDTSKSNTVLSETEEPPLAAQWKIEASGNGYTLQNCYTGLYFSFVPDIPGCTEEPYVWLYDTSKRAFYADDNGVYRYIGWYNNTMWTTAPTAYVGSSYFLKCSGSNTTGTTTENSNYTSSSNIAFTLTSLYNHTDYRNNAQLTLETGGSYIHFTMYNDFQMEYININASGYTSYGVDSTTDTSYPVLYGNANNVRLGRGMYPISNADSSAVTFVDVYGGSTTETVGSTSNDNNAFRISAETGRYSTIHPFNGNGSNAYYGTIYSVYGNDIDRINNTNDQMRIYYRTSVNRSSGLVGHSDPDNPSSIMNVKSGTYGLDYIANPEEEEYVVFAGIYVGSFGAVSDTSKDISDRILLVEGGDIGNIIGGLKLAQGSGVDTKIYVKGGTARNIVGGAGLDNTYEDRIIQVTGGKVRYSISGGSNGVNATTDSNTNGKMQNADILVYVGGNAQIGEAATVGTSLYGVEAGSVLGAGNGNSSVTDAGRVDTSHIIINQNAHIMNSVYGGGNYGIVGDSGSTNATAKIDILGGTIDKNVYGGANQNDIYGSATINMSGGHVKGTIYGGSNSKGTIATTSTINITGGTLGVDENTTENPVLFGGGYGESTVVTGEAAVNILDTHNNVKIYGSCYGGSSLGKMSSNVNVNIKDLPNIENTIDINGYVFAGGKGNSSTAATIQGTATIEVDGSNIPNCSVFGGNDINGTTSGNITVNIGKTNKSTVGGVYGGGNQASITTTTPNVKVYLMSNADVTNAFNGGKAADLISSSATDSTRAIYLQGGHAKNLFGGSDSSGTVTVSNVYIESGTAENVYGGNNIGGTTSTSNISVTGGTVTNVFGGGYQAATTATNVRLTGGTVTNGFGGGNAANVTNSSITLAGSNSTNIYGGSNEQGIVTTSYVAINSGTVKNVFGGNNAGGTTTNAEVIVTGSAQNVYGGGNEAVTTGTTSVILTNANITGNAFGGGNGSAAVVVGNSEITVEGNTTIAGDLFGGGNAAANGTANSSANTTVKIAGATINGDVYGAANTSVVNGTTNVKVGTTAIGNDRGRGNIEILGTIFGGGKSNKAGSDDYDFNFESVTGDVTVYIDGRNYDDGTYTMNIRGSIFASGNAAKISGNGYINIAYYGSANNLKTNVSIQRATRVKMNSCGIYLSGTTDRTNEISHAVYTFNRINELVMKNNTVLYLENGANLVEKLTSMDNNEDKAEVIIGNNGITSQNVDNRIYLSQGKNLILRTEDGANGEVSGMTYVGLYKGTLERITGIYSSNYIHGATIPEDEATFERNSYVQGKHYENHNIEIDGFYTNYNEEGTISTQYIIPTPEVGAYYQWGAGTPTDDIYYENIELIATKYATTSTHVLELTGLNYPNMTLEILGFDTSDLKDGITFIDKNNIPNIEMDKTKANSTFALTMSTGNVGWQTRGATEFFTTENSDTGRYEGKSQYQSENSTTTPSFNIYMANSKNISTNEILGTVTIKMRAQYIENEELKIRDVFVILNISTNNTIKLANDYYEGAITPGKKYDMFPTTNTNITSKSSLSSYYSLYLGDYSKDEEYYFDENAETGIVGYYHCLIASCVLPAQTKITMIDTSKENIKYYYYIVTEDDEKASRKEFRFTDFTEMGSTNKKYDSDLAYYIKELDVVLEEYIFQVDFEDTTLTQSLEKQTLTVEMRDVWDDKMKVNVNTEQYPMMFNIYADKEAIKKLDVNTNDTYIYMGDTFNVNLSTEYTYLSYNSELVYDTTHFEDQLGVKVTILEGSTPLTSSELTGIYLEHSGKKYFARHDGTYRIKIADAMSNILTNIMFYTENGDLDTAAYTVKFETFGSIDGEYYSETIATDSINMLIINNSYGLSADLDKKSVLIDKTTGLTQNNNNELSFDIGYQAEFTNPKIHISMYRRNYDTIYDSKYSLVNLTEYVENDLTPSEIENEYLVTDKPQATQNIILKLKQNLMSGTYKIVFSLYDGENYIGNIDKMIIIK